jgi:hypothetical protein
MNHRLFNGLLFNVKWINNLSFIMTITGIFFSNVIFAQVFVEQGVGGTTRDGGLIVYGMNGASAKIPYEKIKGSPFLKSQWHKASLFDQNGKLVGRYDVRLNLVTHELHFMDKNGLELAANDNLASKVLFEDTTHQNKSPVVFDNSYVPINNMYNNNRKYAESMNAGEYCLLKVQIRTAIEGDSLFATRKKYYFTDRVDYFLGINKKVERLKKLQKENILPFLPNSDKLKKWVKENNLRLSSEEDVIRLLDYCNELIKTSH